jgi:hypothetical protein
VAIHVIIVISRFASAAGVGEQGTAAKRSAGSCVFDLLMCSRWLRLIVRLVHRHNHCVSGGIGLLGAAPSLPTIWNEILQRGEYPSVARAGTFCVKYNKRSRTSLLLDNRAGRSGTIWWILIHGFDSFVVGFSPPASP